jgi:hypothetical protein
MHQQSASAPNEKDWCPLMHVHYQRCYINYELWKGRGSCVLKLTSQGLPSVRGGWPKGSACNPELNLHDSHTQSHKECPPSSALVHSFILQTLPVLDSISPRHYVTWYYSFGVGEPNSRTNVLRAEYPWVRSRTKLSFGFSHLSKMLLVFLPEQGRYQLFQSNG